jgi:hypothetical protein
VLPSSDWIATLDPHAATTLLLFFLYSIPCELFVSLAPHEPAVLYVARFHDALIVALIAGAGTLVAELLNFRIMGHLASAGALAGVRSGRFVQRLTDAFGRAPFASLWIAGFVPFIPFFPFRVLVVLHGYPRAHYLAAAVSSRTTRFYFVALAGAALSLPLSALALLFAVLLLGVTVPGVVGALRRSRWGASCASSR